MSQGSAVIPEISVACTIYLGLDVHKESVTIAVLPEVATVPTTLGRLPNDFVKLVARQD
ncbi:MAG: hypothetical protein ACR2M1_09500 [Gemmatimonadaceae bacterium]